VSEPSTRPEVRCKPINAEVELHYWTQEEPGSPCECAGKLKPTPEQRQQAKAASFADWWAKLLGARRET
jgi:hypothetical protein